MKTTRQTTDKPHYNKMIPKVKPIAALAAALILAGPATQGMAQATAQTPAPADTLPNFTAPRADLPPQDHISTPGPKMILSRQQCLEIALRDNPTVKIADMEVTRVDY